MASFCKVFWALTLTLNIIFSMIMFMVMIGNGAGALGGWFIFFFICLICISAFNSFLVFIAIGLPFYALVNRFYHFSTPAALMLGVLVGAGHFFIIRFFYASILRNDVPEVIYPWLLGGLVFGLLFGRIYAPIDTSSNETIK